MHVLHVISSLGDGGAEAVLYRLCLNNNALTHTVISFMDDGKYGSMLAHAGVRVHCLHMQRGKFSFKAIVKLWQLVKEERPDVVQTWMYHADLLGGVLAKLAGIRKVFWGIRQSELKRGRSRWSTILIARLNAFLSGFIPDKIICCAERARTVHIGLGYSPTKCLVIPNGYDLDYFSYHPQKRQLIRAKWDVDDSVPLLGMVARFDPQKDHLNFLESLALLKLKGWSFRCALVGYGLTPDNETLCSYIKKCELNQELILMDQQTDIAAIMSALDLHVLSSAFGEGFPNVVAEAMACTIPCISTDVGDAAAIVGDTGWIVTPNNANALVGAIEFALSERRDQPHIWISRKLAARERIKDSYELQTMSNAYEHVWRGRDLSV